MKGNSKSARGMAAAIVAALLATGSGAALAQQPAGGVEMKAAEQKPPLSQELVDRRAAEGLAAIRMADAAELKRFMAANFAPGLPPPVQERIVNMISGIRSDSGSLTFVSAAAVGPDLIAVEADNALTGWRDTVMLRLEAEAPHRIRAVGLNLPEPPARLNGRLSDAAVAAAAKQLASRLASADGFSGAYLIARGDKVVASGVHGEANKDFGVPNRLDTRFNLGSMNKMFTAVAIAQLVEAGKLSFEDPVSKFLPDLLAPGAAEKIRIKHLLTHSGGLGSHFTEKFMNASRANFRNTADYLELVRGAEPAFEPGTRWDYSNSGFLVLGRIVEIASGRDYHDYVREKIYLPAGMTSTGEFELDKVNRNLAVGYERSFEGGGKSYRNNIFEHVIRGGPAGGGYSTAGDLHRFATALLAGRLVSPEMVKTLTTPKPELASSDYGYGFAVSPDGRVVGHSGGFPGISSNLDIHPNTAQILVILSNYGMAGMKLLPLRQLMLAQEAPAAPAEAAAK
jgi:CubicO group peptidase (beta-lactamase class C family)